MALRRLTPFAVLLGVAATGCSTDPDDFSRCSPPLDITVTQAPLAFAWAPSGCEVEGLTVIQGNTTAIVWSIQAVPDHNTIESPVQFGVAPDNVSDSGADSLVVGPYTVRLTRLNAEGTALEISDQDFSFSGR